MYWKSLVVFRIIATSVMVSNIFQFSSWTLVVWSTWPRTGGPPWQTWNLVSDKQKGGFRKNYSSPHGSLWDAHFSIRNSAFPMTPISIPFASLMHLEIISRVKKYQAPFLEYFIIDTMRWKNKIKARWGNSKCLKPCYEILHVFTCTCITLAAGWPEV